VDGHPAAGRGVARTDNSAGSSVEFEAQRERFLQYRKQIEAHYTAEMLAKEKRIAAQKDAKAAGFNAKLFVIARALTGTDKQASAVKKEVKNRLLVARYLGDPLGNQLDLFVDATRIETVDHRAEGMQASRDNKPAKSPHAPGTEAYTAWMAGYQEHQATLAKGFKPLQNGDDQDDEPDDGGPDDGEDWGDDQDPARPIA